MKLKINQLWINCKLMKNAMTSILHNTILIYEYGETLVYPEKQ
jgi:hypothetical protein